MDMQNKDFAARGDIRLALFNPLLEMHADHLEWVSATQTISCEGDVWLKSQGLTLTVGRITVDVKSRMLKLENIKLGGDLGPPGSPSPPVLPNP